MTTRSLAAVPAPGQHPRIELAHGALELLIAHSTQDAERGQHAGARRALARAEAASVDELYAACAAALRTMHRGRPRQDAVMLEEPAQHRLSAARRESIFSQQILPLTAASSRAERRAWLLIGARGAGLSTLRLRAASRHAAVEIAAAHLATLHPDYPGLLETSDKTAEACVAADAQAWAQTLLSHALAADLPVVVEHTDPASKSCADMLSSIREAGYTLEILALAADHATCLLGVHRRYERLLADCGRAPFTLHEALVRAQRGVPAFLERLSASASQPAVTVLGRSGRVLHCGASGAAERVRAEQSRPLTAAEKAELASGWLEVWRLKQGRRAPRPDLEAVRAHQQRALREAFAEDAARSALQQTLDPDSYDVATRLAR